MKLRCVNNSGFEDLLTLGRVYAGEREDDGYYIVLDDGTCEWVFECRFEVIHEQAEVVIAHPYTVLTWTKDRGFQPCGAVFKTAQAVFDWAIAANLTGEPAYIHTPSGCLYTPNAIKTLGLNLWKEVNKE